MTITARARCTLPSESVTVLTSPVRSTATMSSGICTAWCSTWSRSSWSAAPSQPRPPGRSGSAASGQTLGRTLCATLARCTGVTTRTVVLIGAGGATTALLAAVPGPTVLLLAIAILAGTVRGNLTLLQATAVSDRWGTASYGRLSALLAAPATIAGALAPWATTALTPALGGGHPALFLTLTVIAATAAAVAAAARPSTQAA
ncbi:hypothetical protein ACFY4B_41435 [Kitasatospora sp. NPDC001261]|uniref:hypothetical protein n=1 Tax=Kitasatospora sp. NPDC001261 TaxID=3364012 RepID=UPI0036CEA440